MNELGLADKTALVTGGGRGMGKAVAEALARAGARVVVADINFDNAAATAASIENRGQRALPLSIDISRVGAIARAFEEMDAAIETLDIAVLAAGVLRARPLLEHTEGDWDYMADINLKGTFFTLQAAARRMLAQGAGAILTFSSTSAFVSSRVPEIAYDVTKGGIRQMTVSAAAELAPFGIRVNSLAPGTIVTDFNRATLNTPDAVRSAEQHLPMGRLGSPDDVVGAALFLCSPAASYVTGHHLVVDGGRLTRAG